ncbi:MAG: hypothetical protein Q4P18_02780 [Methanobrevibacter sp.]|uniref:hypothetical protein n=1 Tax=Methanobrevibacter sp. TaxID=66852 RepID=UPI0026DFABF7|nr:hypothetical protein [Methanobrevibacter sp.]MDO5848436.1 hypothetical protein [Methanobrevibacter sp.]
MNKKTGIAILISVIVIAMALCASFVILTGNAESKNANVANNTTNVTENITNVTEDISSGSSSKNSGAYGYCAICGAALSASEANDDYTQGKVCRSCAKNPYYQSSPGSDYANQKLYEKYPEEYSWMDKNNNGLNDGLE